jgi:hypothetical protein
MIEKFPTSEIGAKDIKVSDWNKSIFKTKQDGTNVKVTIPKNAESHADNLFFITILKCFALLRWVPVLSETELPPSVLETKESPFFSGFVAAAATGEVGDRETGTSKWCKGFQSYQLWCVNNDHTVSSAPYMRHGGVEDVTAKLSGMKGFTKEYWGLRGSISAIFKSLPRAAARVDLNSYMKSKEEILKNVIRRKLPHENGGVFRPDEIAYLNERYAQTKQLMEQFVSDLNDPEEGFAAEFGDKYGVIRVAVKSIEAEIGPLVGSRAKVLFPVSKKKGILTWAKKPLEDKMDHDFLEKHDKLFMPASLPGIDITPTKTTEVIGTQEWINAKYRFDASYGLTIEKLVSSYYTLVASRADENNSE